MSQKVATPDEATKETKPVGTQEVSSGDEEFQQKVAEAVKNQFEVTAWKPRVTTKFVIDFASGQRALVKYLDTMDLVRGNLIEELDFFTKKLFPAAVAGAEGKDIEEKAEKSVWAVLNDPEKRCRFLELTNRLMSVASIKPKIVNDGVALKDSGDGEKIDVFGTEVDSIDEQIKLFGKPIPPLKEGEVYASSINFGDRMLFFTELNKPLEVIEPFREGSNAVLASLEPNPSSEVQAK
jgi:hypothetical protein